MEDDRVTRIQGDADDVFSAGFICPKGGSLAALHDDPDRLRVPLVKQSDGTFAEATWDEAFAVIERRLPPIQAEHGRDSVAAYLGNPSAHNLSQMLYGRVLLKALGTKNITSASTVDQYPKQLASGLMFGTAVSVPIPDLDRTDHLLILGANPLASNGSLMTAPNVRGRLRAIQERGGKVVVVDPRRTRTAQVADEHVFIRPGTDSLLLFAMVHVLFAESLVAPGAQVDGLLDGLDELRELAAGFPPAEVAAACGIPADVIERMARELAAAQAAAVYGRIGTTTTTFGTTASWLVDVLNVLTGNLDRPGGAMFTTPATGGPNLTGEPGRGRGVAPGRFSSRVRGLPEVFGELPAAVLAEEIQTPGEGRVRALITMAGNPIVSTPNSSRLAAAFDELEFMVSVDIYLNETTRHADVILPVPSPLERPHYDVALYSFAIRDVANYSPPLFDPPAGMPHEWETLLRLVGVVTGQGADASVPAIDAFVAGEAVRRAIGATGSVIADRSVDEILAALAPRVGPERLLDLLLRTGPYGDGFGAGDAPGTLSLAALEAEPHGIDLGALKPRLPEVLRTPTGRIDLTPPLLVGDVERLHVRLEEWTVERADPDRPLRLVGRRDLRSNNSWMHNLTPLVKGKERCTVWVHPDDADRLELVDGGSARVTARTGAIELPVQVTADVMPGVVSIPHGWGHDLPGMAMQVAAAHAGVNSNILADDQELEPLSGTAILNGIAVALEPVRVPAAVAG
ncbi:dimethyl sulfoxide reductase DmsA [Paraconexibacter sp. AEG42_29]|uniref:Dimethyl sulfoxide reductase DmsA n=1 Tax=Paraconexibacter sp. AEG42_29 TaxID=2997339 RepID=A0AAU7ATA8_9ACTN